MCIKNNVVVLTNKHRGIDFQMAKHASMLEHCTRHLPTLYLLILLVLCSHIACLHWNLKTCGQRSELSTMLNPQASLTPKHKNIPCESRYYYRSTIHGESQSYLHRFKVLNSSYEYIDMKRVKTGAVFTKLQTKTHSYHILWICAFKPLY